VQESPFESLVGLCRRTVEDETRRVVLRSVGISDTGGSGSGDADGDQEEEDELTGHAARVRVRVRSALGASVLGCTVSVLRHQSSLLTAAGSSISLPRHRAKIIVQVSDRNVCVVCV
jgi:hypothetical protein